MATIKSFTSVEQSRKLAEILPLESADMWYSIVDNEPFVCFERHYEYEQIPCWSLAALLGVLPNKIISHETAFEGEDAEGINDIYHKCIKTIEDDRYTCYYLGNGCKYECIADNIIDACYELILKLHELNLL